MLDPDPRTREAPRRLPVAPGAAVTLAAALLAAALLGAALPAEAAEAGARALPPHITAGGSATVKIPPDEARFSIGVVTDGASAAAAGADNARLTKAVLERLRRAGLPSAAIRSSQVSVYPRWIYDESLHRQRRAGFEANHTIDVETAALAQVGEFLDAALAAGATSVSPVAFSASDQAAARERALAQAVANALADAQTAAHAAGGTLGTLLELSTQPQAATRMPMVGNFMAAAAPSRVVPTQITPDQIRVEATVSGSWRFLAPRR